MFGGRLPRWALAHILVLSKTRVSNNLDYGFRIRNGSALTIAGIRDILFLSFIFHRRYEFIAHKARWQVIMAKKREQ